MHIQLFINWVISHIFQFYFSERPYGYQLELFAEHKITHKRCITIRSSEIFRQKLRRLFFEILQTFIDQRFSERQVGIPGNK